MLSSSLRRAAWTPIVPISGIARATAAGTAGSNSGNAQQHVVRQRRYSSSSSSKPSDGSSRGIDASSSSSSSQAPAKNVDGSGENNGNKREGKGRRRGKQQQQQQQQQQQDAVFSKLPSVPSTQYQQPHDVHVASFFSIHRPISVSTTVPPASNQEAFETIFSSSSRKSLKSEQDVMSTLSSAVQSMENSAHHLAEQDNLPKHQVEVDVQPYDSMNMADMKLSVEELTKRLRPFHPPPPPVSFDEAKNVVGAANASQSENSSSSMGSSQESSSYSTVLTIHESTDATGRKTYEAHTSPFVRTKDMDAPGATTEHNSYIDVPRRRPTTYIERLRNNRTMHAISTKRRRRAKIKKHKYKKLLRKTRTLRRKLDKA